MNLLYLLQALARPDVGVTDRQAAARALASQVERQAPGMLRGLRYEPTTLEDARQHLLLKASVGSTRFRGESEGEAYVWCRTVLRNFVLGELRKRANEALVDDPDRPTEHIPVSSAPAPTATAEGLRARLDAVVSKVLQGIDALHRRPKDQQTVADSVLCYLEATVLGLSAAQQLDRWGYRGSQDDRSDPPAEKRALQRIYQYRRRGAVAWRRLVESLRQRGGLGADELDILNALLLGGAP
jgi:DNA-directed RNA polymerase specialized sigma24 family protein